jgi:molecular chaperone DnaK (HSP70)
VTATSTRAIGIDFGTTNSLVVAYSQLTGDKRVCLDDELLPHPSVVWYRQSDSPIVGREAKKQINSFADAAGNRFVRSIKRALGKDAPVEVFGENKSAVDVASEIFRYLKQQALEVHKVDVREAVVTVPVRMDGHARRDLRKAAEIAGIFIKTFIHEPFAALYAYLVESGSNLLATPEPINCVVFDWGGGTLDVTVVRIQSGYVHELAVSGLNDLAGDYFDLLLGQIVKRKFCEARSIKVEDLQLSRRATDVLEARCEQAKIRLSSIEMATVEVAGFSTIDGRLADLSVVVTRQEFEAAIRSEVHKALAQVNVALETADLTPEQIDVALLVGGTSQIPLVAEALREKFGSSIRPLANASSLIAEGAAIVSARGIVPAFSSGVSIELATYREAEVHFPIFEAGHAAIPEDCHREIEMFCTDPRSGLATLIFGSQCDIRATYERLKVMSIPVSNELPKPYDQEGVQVRVSLDKDLVLNVEAWGDTKDIRVRDEVVNLRYSLPIRGA